MAEEIILKGLVNWIYRLLESRRDLIFISFVLEQFLKIRLVVDIWFNSEELQNSDSLLHLVHEALRPAPVVILMSTARVIMMNCGGLCDENALAKGTMRWRWVWQ